MTDLSNSSSFGRTLSHQPTAVGETPENNNDYRSTIRSDLVRMRERIGVPNLDLNCFWDEILMKIPASILAKPKSEVEDVMEKDMLVAQAITEMISEDVDYATLAGNYLLYQFEKQCAPTFSQHVAQFAEYVVPKTNRRVQIISQKLAAIVKQHAAEIDAAIDHTRNRNYDFSGAKKLVSEYFIKTHDQKPCECAQYMLMRVALGLCDTDVPLGLETYRLMSEKFYTHATPTLFNSGTYRPQNASCFLVAPLGDSMEGISKVDEQFLHLSKYAGGLGVALSMFRAKNSFIATTLGHSNGLVPLIRKFSSTVKYADQGGGRRDGSFNGYIEPWHDDILDILAALNPELPDDTRINQFITLWVANLIWERMEKDQPISLFCPNEIPESDDEGPNPPLYDIYGEEFERYYAKYERKGYARRTVRGADLLDAIARSAARSGKPSVMFKDHVNQFNLEDPTKTIRSANLCTEIVEYAEPGSVAVCNLASLVLPTYVKTREDGSKYFDYQLLHQVARHAVIVANNAIDYGFIPIPEAVKTNQAFRPLGIGQQGLADVFKLMHLPFASPEAGRISRLIAETIYHGGWEASVELAKKHGPFPEYARTRLAQGKMHHELYESKPISGWDFDQLSYDLRRYGARNSHITTVMPNAGTAILMGCTEMTEPISGLLFVQKLKAGYFTRLDPHLQREMKRRGLWNKQVWDILKTEHEHAILNPIFPKDIQEVYLPVALMKQSILLERNADRQPLIDQAASCNYYFIHEPGMSSDTYLDVTAQKVKKVLSAAYHRKMKNGLYYCRTVRLAKAHAYADKKGSQAPTGQAEAPAMVCTKEEGCLMCSS